VSHAVRENCSTSLPFVKECHFCQKVGHLKRSCRKYLKKIKEKQVKMEKRKEDLDKTWKNLLTKTIDETKLLIRTLQEDVIKLKSQISKQNDLINQQNERTKSQPYLTRDFFVDLICKSSQVIVEKIHESIMQSSSDEETSSSSEEEIMVFGPRISVTSTSKKKEKQVHKKSVKQEKDPSLKRKGKQNNANKFK